MAAPTNAAFVKKALANPEPSTHDPKQNSVGWLGIYEAQRDEPMKCSPLRFSSNASARAIEKSRASSSNASLEGIM